MLGIVDSVIIVISLALVVGAVLRAAGKKQRPEVKRVIAPKALDRFKRRIREITRRAKGVSMKTTMEELVPYMRGWCSYFGFCETSAVLQYLTRWSGCGSGRSVAAVENTAPSPAERLASNTAGSRRGPWYLARSRALFVGLSNAYFRSLGLPSLVEEC